MTTEWRDLDFRPAPPGWRVWYRTDENTWSRALAGWLIQEETQPGTDQADDDRPAEDRRRRVAAAVYIDMPPYLMEVEDDNQAWAILGPGDPGPSDEDRATVADGYREARDAALAARVAS